VVRGDARSAVSTTRRSSSRCPWTSSAPYSASGRRPRGAPSSLPASRRDYRRQPTGRCSWHRSSGSTTSRRRQYRPPRILGREQSAALQRASHAASSTTARACGCECFRCMPPDPKRIFTPGSAAPQSTCCGDLTNTAGFERPRRTVLEASVGSRGGCRTKSPRGAERVAVGFGARIGGIEGVVPCQPPEATAYRAARPPSCDTPVLEWFVRQPPRRAALATRLPRRITTTTGAGNTCRSPACPPGSRPVSVRTRGGWS
jgi:hypothetical protein